MRLTDRLAARRCLYPSPLPTAPSIILVDVPRRWAGPGLLLGRYYPAILETEAEVAEFDAFLSAPRTGIVSPALFETRPSNLQAAAVTFIEYSPPIAGWPWILISHWPADLAAIGDPKGDLLARNAYMIEAHASLHDLRASAARCVALFDGPATVHVVNPKLPAAAAGHA